MAQGKKRLSKKGMAFLGGLVGVLLIVTAWWIASAILESEKTYVLPSPYGVFLSLLEVLFGAEAGETYAAVGFTLARSLGGFAAAFVLAFALACLGHEFPFFASIVAPWNKFAKVFPTAAVSLILIVVFSREATMMNLIPAFLSFLVTEPIVYEGFRNGLKKGPGKDELEALSLDGGTRTLRGLWAVELPAAGGYVLTSVASSLGLGIKVTIMSEVLANFSNVNKGIGSLIVLSQQYAIMDDLIAYSLLAIVVSAAFDLVSYLIRKGAALLEERKKGPSDRRLE